MKKLLVIIACITTILFLESCERICNVCRNYENECICSYNSDEFRAEKLLGTWQCEYTTIVGNMHLKQIKFMSHHKCDITYSINDNTSWWTDTYEYSYSSGYLRFYTIDNSFSFKVKDYCFPELKLMDSFGIYIIRKVKSYGC